MVEELLRLFPSVLVTKPVAAHKPHSIIHIRINRTFGMNENKNNIEYLPVVKSYTLYIYMDDFKVYKKYGNNVGMNSDTIIHR